MSSRPSTMVMAGIVLSQPEIVTMPSNMWLRATSSTESAITYIDGDAGILRYRGYDIESLAEQEHPSFLETAWLVIYGELPTAAERTEFSRQIGQALWASALADEHRDLCADQVVRHRLGKRPRADESDVVKHAQLLSVNDAYMRAVASLRICYGFAQQRRRLGLSRFDHHGADLCPVGTRGAPRRRFARVGKPLRRQSAGAVRW